MTLTTFTNSFFTDNVDNLEVVEIPLENVTPWFSQRVTLSEEVFRFEFRYNNRCQKWAMSVYDQNDTALFEGAFCCAGINYIRYVKSNLWPDDAITLQFFDDFAGTTEPTYDNIGKEVKLLYVYALEQAETTISAVMDV